MVSDWYCSRLLHDSENTDAVTGAAKAFLLIGDLYASAVGMAWQTIVPELLDQGHDLEFNVTKEHETAAAARRIVAVANTFAPPSLDIRKRLVGMQLVSADYLHDDGITYRIRRDNLE